VRFNRVRFHAKARSREVKTLVYFGLAVLLRQAGFPTKKRFEDLVPDTLSQDGREALPALKALTFLTERRNVILMINEMVEARNENRLSLYLLQFKKIDLLILDELERTEF